MSLYCYRCVLLLLYSIRLPTTPVQPAKQAAEGKKRKHEACMNHTCPHTTIHVSSYSRAGSHLLVVLRVGCVQEARTRRSTLNCMLSKISGGNISVSSKNYMCPHTRRSTLYCMLTKISDGAKSVLKYQICASSYSSLLSRRVLMRGV